jgi:hypothetical protein
MKIRFHDIVWNCQLVSHTHLTLTAYRNCVFGRFEPEVQSENIDIGHRE